MKVRQILLVALCIGFLGSAAGSGFLFFQNHRLSGEMAKKQLALDEAQKKTAELERELKEAKEELAKLNSTSKEELATTDAASSVPGTDSSSASAESMPDAKANYKEYFKGAGAEMIANSSVNMMYGDLLKEMKLTPEEKEQLHKILVDSQTQLMQSLGDGKDLSQRGQQVADWQKVMDAKIKQLVGDDRFGQYESYKKEIPDRMQANQFEQSIAMSSTPLTADQKKQMIDVMSSEREKYASEMQAAVANGQNRANAADMMQALNPRINNRLATVLQPEQLKALTKWQDSMAQLIRNMSTKSASSDGH